MAGGDFTYALPPFETTNRIVDELLKCNIKLVCSLPDGWIANLIGTLERDERFIHVPVNREEAAVAMCSGAFLSGTGSLALMGASGLMTCIYVITKISYTYMLPSLIFITMRGTIGDYAPHHVSNGLYLTRVMDAISLPYYVVDEPDKIANISRGYKMARAHSRPFVVGFTRDVFREGD
jgi:sulfopyruvate decarboxylase TPP-binding subunit